MIELDKLKKEFEKYCGSRECGRVDCDVCAIDYMFSREQKLKSEAVKVTEELRMEILISNAATYDYKFNIMAHRYNRKIESAVKKIEGL